MAELINILQIDVEDWYSDTDIKTWNCYEDRVVQNTEKVLAILREGNIKATFFVLGYVENADDEMAAHAPDCLFHLVHPHDLA